MSIFLVLIKFQEKLKSAKTEKDAEIAKLVAQWDKKEKARVAENKEKITALNKKVFYLNVHCEKKSQESCKYLFTQIYSDPQFTPRKFTSSHSGEDCHLIPVICPWFSCHCHY